MKRIKPIRTNSLLAMMVAGVVLAGAAVVVVAGNDTPAKTAAPGALPSATPSASPTGSAAGSARPSTRPSSSALPQVQSSGIGEDGLLPMQMRLSPTCASTGTLMQVVIQSVPKLMTTVAVVFQDGQTHDLYFQGNTGTTGRVVHTFTVPVGAMIGQASVFAVGARQVPDGGGSATTNQSFEVALPGGCG